jgi:ABC-2 type transport system permease protein
MTALAVVARLTVRALLAGWRTLAAVVLACLPALLCAAVLWVRAATDLSALSPGALWRVLIAGYMHVLAILSALLFASAAIADDAEDGSVFYLLVRPVRRSLVYLGKALAAVQLAVLTTAGSVLLCALVLALAPASGIPLATLARDLGWAALAAASYALALAAVAALSRRALLFSTLYLLFFELPMAFAPVGLRLLTISHYLMSLLPHPSRWHAVIRAMGLASTTGAAWIGLIALLAAWTAIGALRYERREQLPG